MDTINRLRRGWLTLAAVVALALLPAACAAEAPPRAETESITGDAPPDSGGPPANGGQAAGDGQPGGDGTVEVGDGGPAGAAAGGDGTSRDAPFPPGQVFEIGEWQVAVRATNTDATQIIRAENQFNSPPPGGHVFALARVDLRYQGEGSGQAWLDLGFQVLTPDGNTHGGYPETCGVIPEDLLQIGEMFTGASSSGNVCVVVPAAQVEGAMWVVDESFSIGDGTRMFVAFE